VLVVVAVLALTGASVIVGRMTAAVENAGAEVDLGSLFTLSRSHTAAPDAEVQYTSYEGESLSVSIFRPRAATAPAPVLVFVHGDGWVAGDRLAHSTDLRWFADQGWLTISVGYTLSLADRHQWDVTQRQIGCALAWGDHAAAYGGDPRRLSMSGDSAGGNLAINSANLAAYDSPSRRARRASTSSWCRCPTPTTSSTPGPEASASRPTAS
jgi:acetyl esterase/lipase